MRIDVGAWAGFAFAVLVVLVFIVGLIVNLAIIIGALL